MHAYCCWRELELCVLPEERGFRLIDQGVTMFGTASIDLSQLTLRVQLKRDARCCCT